MKKKIRLDQFLVKENFLESMKLAQAFILEGRVLVNEQKILKAGTEVVDDVAKTKIRLLGKIEKYVSRGGFKLEKALQIFSIDCKNKIVADFGASTGGFTDCVLQAGAKKVYAIDVGYGQLAWALRENPKVVNLERTNVRSVSKENLGEAVDLCVTDCAFISLKKIFPAMQAVLAESGDAIALVKPQFEAQKNEVEAHGIVRDVGVHQRILHEVIDAARQENLFCQALTFSPIKGMQGNIEYLLWLKNFGAAQSIDIEKIVQQAHESLKN